MNERVCEQCGSDIPEEWLTEEMMGTCPHCKKLVSFIEKCETEEERIAKQKEEEERLQKQYRQELLNRYAVVEQIDENSKPHVDCVQLSKLILNECGLHFHTVEDEDTGKQEVFFYEGGYYHRGGENRIKTLVDQFLENLTAIHRKNEVLDYIRNIKYVKRCDMEPPVNLINLKNGIYDLSADKLIPHDPKYFFLNQIPVEYNPTADCPKIKKFFSDVLYPEYVPVMQESIGYCLYRDYIFHKAFMMLGGGRNGKGTTINLIHALLGKHNCSSQSLHNLIENRFAKSSLYGKLVNLGAEVSGRAISETADFKNLTGGEPITAERKNYGAYSFRNYAKLFFNVNNMIRPKYDKSQAYYDRWVIFAFPKTFELGDGVIVVDIINELTTKEELEGLLNWSIEGLKRLLKNKNFSPTMKNDDFSGEYYDNLMKPENLFINDYLTITFGTNIDKEKVYYIYQDWATKRRYPILSKTAFTRAVKTKFTPTEKQIKEGADKFVLEIIDTRCGGDRCKQYKDISWKCEVYEEVKKMGCAGTLTNLESYESKAERVEKSLSNSDDDGENGGESEGEVGGIQW